MNQHACLHTVAHSLSSVTFTPTKPPAEMMILIIVQWTSVDTGCLRVCVCEHPLLHSYICAESVLCCSLQLGVTQNKVWWIDPPKYLLEFVCVSYPGIINQSVWLLQQGRGGKGTLSRLFVLLLKLFWLCEYLLTISPAVNVFHWIIWSAVKSGLQLWNT